MTTKLQSDKVHPSVLDLRVRERNLRNGTLDPKVLETYMAELVDLESQGDELSIAQPALSGDDDDGDD